MRLKQYYRLSLVLRMITVALALTLVHCVQLTAPKVPATKSTQVAKEEYFTRQPLLRINSAMHTAPIRRIATDAQQRWLVTASDDKSIRLWDAKTGDWLKTYRLPSEPGHVGRAYAVAMSPDGKSIAVGGFTGRYSGEHNLYFFDRESGELVDRIGELPNVIFHLSYSPKGRYLVATLAGNNGIRVYRTSDYQLQAQDKQYSGDSYGADFDRQGRLVTSSLDGTVRLYNPGFKLIDRFDTQGKSPYGVAFSPNGDRIAVSYYNSLTVDIIDSRTMQRLYSADTTDLSGGNLMTVAWSADGRRLLAGGEYDDGTGRPLLRWSQQGQGTRESWPAADNIIIGIQPLADGGVLVGTGDPTLMRLDASGKTRWQHRPQLVDFRGQRGKNSIQLANNGSRVRFGYQQWGEEPVGFDLQRLLLERSIDAHGLAGADTQSLKVEDWENEYSPSVSGQSLALDQWETSRSLAIAPNTQSFVLGTEWSLRWFKANGQAVGERVALSSVALTVNISADGRWLVAGLGNGTLRWYDYVTHEEKLALYVRPEDDAWVLWTPEGFFASSPDAESLVGYQLNRGLDQAPDFVTGEQLYETFYRPDLVLAKFAGKQEAITRALAEVGDIRSLLQTVRPPVVTLTKKIPKTIQGTALSIPINIEDQGSGIGAIEVRVNGILQPSKNFSMRNSLGNATIAVNVPTDQTSSVEIRVASASVPGKGLVYSSPQTIEVTSSESTTDQKPTLYGLAIGIEKYQDSRFTLTYANDDVTALLGTLHTYSAPLFRDIQIKPLRDAKKQTILDAFKAVPKSIKPEDVFIFYLSGHGIAMDGEFYFLPQDFIFKNENSLKEGAITQKQLIDFIASVRAEKMVVIIDSCFAASFDAAFGQLLAFNSKGVSDKTAIAKLMKTTGRAIFYASSDKQVALEGYKGKSLYTGVLLEGLMGPAAFGDGVVTLDELRVYLDQHVPIVSKEIFGTAIYPMATINSKYPIPIAIVD